MRTFAIRFAFLLATATACRGLAAQEIPSIHAGQWAAEFTGGNWSNAGVMRFFSPRSALVLSASGSLSHNTATPDGGSAATSTSQSLFLALGVRRHATVASRVVATTEIGAGVGFSRSKNTSSGLGNPVYQQRNTSYGIYGEFGGQYFVASHLALGAVASIGGSVSSGRDEAAGTGTDYRGFNLSASLRPVRVTLYF